MCASSSSEPSGTVAARLRLHVFRGHRPVPLDRAARVPAGVVPADVLEVGHLRLAVSEVRSDRDDGVLVVLHDNLRPHPDDVDEDELEREYRTLGFAEVAATEAGVAERIRDFHRGRLMFAWLSDGRYVASYHGDERGHAEWLAQEYGEAPELRGYVDRTGFYVYNAEFGCTDAEWDRILRSGDLRRVACCWGAPDDPPVWRGVVPGESGTRWPGARRMGTITEVAWGEAAP